MFKLTKPQSKSLLIKWQYPEHGQGMTFLQFRRTVTYHGLRSNFPEYIGVQWCGMFVGIEKDGYAHT